MSTKRVKRSTTPAIGYLEKLNGGPLTLGQLVASIRLGDEMTQPEFAKRLGISKSSLNDLEKNRKLVSPARAARYAKALGYPAELFVKLSLQDQLDQGGLRMKIDVKAA